jgi:iron-sulfur cluster assembly accessory protein
MNPKKHRPQILNFTTKALAHFKHKVSLQGKENKIKLGVKKMGCNGYSYFFDFVNKPNKSDVTITVDELNFLIPPDSVEILKGSQVDYAIEGLNQGVRFINPNVSAVCGCGESFTVEPNPETTTTNGLKKKK